MPTSRAMRVAGFPAKCRAKPWRVVGSHHSRCRSRFSVSSAQALLKRSPRSSPNIVIARAALWSGGSGSARGCGGRQADAAERAAVAAEKGAFKCGEDRRREDPVREADALGCVGRGASLQWLGG